MSSQAKENGIIVGVDGSAASNAAVCWAARDAVLRSIPLTLLHAVNPVAVMWPQLPRPEQIAEWQGNEGRRLLAEAHQIASNTVKDSGSIRITEKMLFSGTLPALVELSETAELIAVGNNGRGVLARSVLGSVSSNLTRLAHCPVAVIRDAGSVGHEASAAAVLLGIDSSPASKCATAIAFDEASRRRVELTALHAWSDVEIFELPGLDWSAVKAEEERILAEGLAGWQESYPDVTVHKLLVCDRPARVLVEKSSAAQLVVLGSHGRGDFTGKVLGSVSNAVVQAVRVPVILARES